MSSRYRRLRRVLRDGSPIARCEIAVVHHSQPTTLMAEGTLLGGCRIVRFLGRGGMGEVYLAEHLRLQRHVAVKVLPPAHLDRQHVERFLKEARSAAQIDHPNVVTIHDAGEHQGHHFIVMQYVEGKNLAELLMAQGGPLPWRTALAIVRNAAKGLAAVHERGLIHRDIKPSNIMLSSGRRVLLMDFGLVREETPSTRADLTQPGAIVGTPAYMSPEQCRMEATDKRSDVFSLGGTLYTLLTARLPFEGPSQSVLLQVASGKQPMPISTMNRYVPPEVCALVGKMMAFRPAARPSDAGAVAGAIAECLKSPDPTEAVKSDTHPVSHAPTLSRAVESLVPLDSLSSQSWLANNRRVVLSTAGGAAALLLLAFILRTIFAPQDEKALKVQPPPKREPPPGMVLIPAGQVQLGDSRARLREHLLKIDWLKQDPDQLDAIVREWHSTSEDRVFVPAFWIDRHEVSNAEYAKFVEKTGHRPPGPPTHWPRSGPERGTEDYPVSMVNYEDAAAYADWAGKKLPTQAQWERAFRGDTNRFYPWGDEFDLARANVFENKTFPNICYVTATPSDKSDFGVFNLVGNVREIVRDRPIVDGAPAVVLKGSDFHTSGAVFGIASQSHYLIRVGLDEEGDEVGFRCVIEEPESAEKP